MRKLDKLLSFIIIGVCFFAFFYSITGYLAPISVDTSQLISKDLISLEQNRIAAQQHQIDSRMKMIAKYTPSQERSTERPVEPDDATDNSVVQGFKKVGEGLMVPKGKDKNFLFLKTHKCGTSTLVNMLYLFGIRRRLNFVTQPWSRQLDVEQ
jgi:hypothetical protein